MYQQVLDSFQESVAVCVRHSKYVPDYFKEIMAEWKTDFWNPCADIGNCLYGWCVIRDEQGVKGIVGSGPTL